MTDAAENTALTPTRVCGEDELDVGQARRFDIGEHRLAIVRGDECWFAVDDECTHADYSLAEGEVDLEECTIECWKHGSLFSLTSGTAETLPATRAVTVYEVRVADGEVAVMLPGRADSESGDASAANEGATNG
jgi:3-phenylpropionate/trans-cinnamate dioxygenase ferredoxin subunit